MRSSRKGEIMYALGDELDASEKKSYARNQKVREELGIGDMTFQLEYGASSKEFMGARAEVRITPPKNFTVILFCEAYLDPDIRMRLFSVRASELKPSIRRNGLLLLRKA